MVTRRCTRTCASSSRRGIKKGAHVKQGQLLGYMGSNGRSTGPHLLWGVFHNHQPVNPLLYVRGNLKRG